MLNDHGTIDVIEHSTTSGAHPAEPLSQNYNPGSELNEETVEHGDTSSLVDPNFKSEKFDNMSWTRVSLILLGLGLCTFLYAIEQTIVATSISAIGEGVHAKGSLTWITTSYLLTTTVFQPITGRLSDVFGTKRMLLGFVWIFVIGNIIAGSAHNLYQLVAGRLICGVGGAGLLSLTTIIVSQLTHEKQRGSYLNLINAVFIVADSLGPIIGGGLAKSGNWRWIFLLNIPFGPIVTLILVFFVHIHQASPFSSSSPPSSRTTAIKSILKGLDIAGMFMLITSLTLLIVALNLGGDARRWDSPTIIGLLAGSGGSFLAFVFAERSAASPVVPMKLFASWRWRNVPIMSVVRCLLFFHLFAATFYLPIFLQVIGQSSVVAAALVIPFLLTAALSSILTSYITARDHRLVRPVFLFGLVVLPVGMGLLSTLNQHSSIGKFIGYSIISGFGFGSGTQQSIIIAQVDLPDDLLPTVTAFISSTPNLGGVLGVGIVGTVINNVFQSHLSNLPASLNINDAVLASKDPIYGPQVIQAYSDAFKAGFRILAGVAVVQFLLCLGLREVVLRGASNDSDDDVGVSCEDKRVEEKEKGQKREGEGVDVEIEMVPVRTTV